MAATMADVLELSISEKSCKIIGLKVKDKCMLTKGTLIATYRTLGGAGGNEEGKITEKFKANVFGTVQEILVKAGDVLAPGAAVLKYSACTHPTVMKDMCAECGADLRETAGLPGQRTRSSSASVAMVHSIPELQVSKEEALQLANEDEKRLLRSRKLVLVVDLDQTVIHTTMENVKPNLPGIKHFQLWSGRGPQQTPWYHTKIRPGCKKFLEVISKYYELHIFTMGARLYAHTIAGFLDPDKKFFSHRILSRDECFDPNSKTANLGLYAHTIAGFLDPDKKFFSHGYYPGVECFDPNSKTANLGAIFPCGDSMVCIIDDRDDVWNFAPNLVLVRPYRYFEGTGDINAPPGFPPFLRAPKEGGEGKEVSASADKKDKPDRTVEESVGTAKDDESEESDAVEEEKTDKPGDDAISKDDNVTESVSKDDEKLVGASKAETNEKSGSVAKDDMDSSMEVEESKEEKSIGDKAAQSDPSKGEPSKDTDRGSEETTGGPKEGSKVKEELEEGELAKTPEGDTKDQDDGRTDEAKSKPAKDVEPEEDCTDDYFLHLEEILIKIHTKFFHVHDNVDKSPSAPKADLKVILPQVRNSVLKGTHIVFSGVFPTNMPPEQSKAWKAAVALGAQVSPKIVPRDKSGGPSNATTHLIAAKVGTNKVHTALRYKKIHIVTAEWLWCCWERWDHADERLFLLPGVKAKSGTSTPATSDSDVPTKVLSKKRKGTPDGKSKQKRVRIQRDSGIDEVTGSSSSDRTQRQSLSSEYNPLYSFSSEDIQSMDKEVEDIFEDSSSSSSEDSDAEDARSGRSNEESLGSITQMISSSSEESLTGESPRGWSPKKQILDRDSDHEQDRDGSGDSTSSPGVSDFSGDEDLMAEAIDDLLTYSKHPSVSERINLQRQ